MVVILSPYWALAGDYQTKTFVGLGVGGSSLGTSLDAHITARHGKIVASVRYLYTVKEFWPFLPDPEEGSYKFNDFGLLFGYAFEGQTTLLTIEAGLGMTVGKRCHKGRDTLLGPETEYEPLETVIGLIFGSQLNMRLTEHFGIGAYPYLNLNKHENFGGINLEILIGQL